MTDRGLLPHCIITDLTVPCSLHTVHRRLMLGKTHFARTTEVDAQGQYDTLVAVATRHGWGT
jgi:hypothetical protein